MGIRVDSTSVAKPDSRRISSANFRLNITQFTPSSRNTRKSHDHLTEYKGVLQFSKCIPHDRSLRICILNAPDIHLVHAQTHFA